MKLSDVISGLWAIEPNKLIDIQSIYAAHLQGNRIDIAAVERQLGKPLNNAQQTYNVINGVAVLPIEGVIAKKMNMFSQISGGTSSEMAAASLAQAVNDPTVHSIILSIDSPGGTVDGTQAFADAVVAAQNSKPVVTLASGTIASAAYWIGSAASAVYITEATTTVGSIGIVTSHRDVSAAEAAQGIKTTEISAGKYKRIASQYAPLSQEGRQTIQDQLDYTYSLFVGTVAKQRGVSVDKVVADMADGKTFIGQQAIDAGLVDGFATLDSLIAQLNASRPKNGMPSNTNTNTNRAHVALPPQPKKGNTMSTAEQIAAEHPEAAAALRAQGASAERARIQAIEAQCMRGHEALINTMKFDGTSTAGDAAQAVLAAEKSQREAMQKNIAADAPKPLPVAAIPTVDASDAPKQMTRAELDVKAKAYAAENKVSYIEAVKIIQSQFAAA